jgi:hypothetical protein
MLYLQVYKNASENNGFWIYFGVPAEYTTILTPKIP